MRILLVIVGITFILLMGGMAIDGAYERSGQFYQIEDETVTGNPSLSPGIHTLDNSNLNASYRPTVTITNSTETVIMVEDQDYIWHENNGTVEVLAGGRLDGSDQMVVDYKFTIQSEQEQELMTIVGGRTLSASGVLVLAMFGALAVAILKVFGGVG